MGAGITKATSGGTVPLCLIRFKRAEYLFSHPYRGRRLGPMGLLTAQTVWRRIVPDDW
jgi:hypothetical protein